LLNEEEDVDWMRDNLIGSHRGGLGRRRG